METKNSLNPRVAEFVPNKPNKKLVPCRYLGTPNGCWAGPVCRFSHEQSAAGAVATSAVPGVNGPWVVPKKHGPRKTEDRKRQHESAQPQELRPCRYMMKAGQCPFGVKCVFAHPVQVWTCPASSSSIHMLLVSTPPRPVQTHPQINPQLQCQEAQQNGNRTPMVVNPTTLCNGHPSKTTLESSWKHRFFTKTNGSSSPTSQSSETCSPASSCKKINGIAIKPSTPVLLRRTRGQPWHEITD